MGGTKFTPTQTTLCDTWPGILGTITGVQLDVSGRSTNRGVSCGRGNHRLRIINGDPRTPERTCDLA